MASSYGSINSTSPKGGKSEGAAGGSCLASSPKGVGQCLCSPTTHQGSFRCRFHRIMKISKSMPANQNSVPSSVSPNSVEST